jgi:glucan 1,3-beta-glucosidase
MFQRPVLSRRFNLCTNALHNMGGLVNTSMSEFGFTIVGEFSNAVTDCGLFLNGVGMGSRYEGTYTSGVWPPI